jgi:hypothetical protein
MGEMDPHGVGLHNRWEQATAQFCKSHGINLWHRYTHQIKRHHEIDFQKNRKSQAQIHTTYEIHLAQLTLIVSITLLDTSSHTDGIFQNNYHINTSIDRRWTAQIRWAKDLTIHFSISKHPTIHHSLSKPQTCHCSVSTSPFSQHTPEQLLLSRKKSKLETDGILKHFFSMQASTRQIAQTWSVNIGPVAIYSIKIRTHTV